MAYGYTSQYAPGGKYSTNTTQYPIRVASPGGSYYPGKPPLDPSPEDTRYSGGPANPPATAPGTTQPGSPGSSSSGGNNYYNWEGDPFLLQMKALLAKNRTEADAQKNDALRKSILSSGIGSLAEKLFGSDTAFIQSVKDNPFSGMGEIRNMYEGVGGKVNQTNEALNTDNLFFSSYRTGEALPAVYRQRQGDEYDLTNQTQGAIDSVNAAYANKLQEFQMQELQAQQEAWMRAMQSGAMSGVGPSGGGQPGGGGDIANGARPGEWADLPLASGWEPWRNTDATYDMSGATPDGAGGYIGPQGQRYDDKGRVR